MSITKAIEFLKQGTAHAFKPVGDSVLVVTPNAIVIRHFQKYQDGTKQDVLAIKVGNQIVGNSSGLGNGSVVTSEQTALAELVPMIPFGVMRQAKLNLSTFNEIDRGADETIYRKHVGRISESGLKSLKSNKTIKDLKHDKGEVGYDKVKYFEVSYFQSQHFTGPRLFSVDSRVFLLDVDRGELQHGIINPFLVELQDGSVATIKDAYESLKPVDVKQAESIGVDVKRQGEWFFVPVSNDLIIQKIKNALELKRKEFKDRGENAEFIKRWATRGELRAGNNRPNRVSIMAEVDGKFYVSGMCEHSGREHEPIELKGYYLAIPNTATTSWTITGDID